MWPGPGDHIARHGTAVGSHQACPLSPLRPHQPRGEASFRRCREGRKSAASLSARPQPPPTMIEVAEGAAGGWPAPFGRGECRVRSDQSRAGPGMLLTQGVDLTSQPPMIT